MMEPLKRRVQLMICRAVIRAVNDGTKLQSLQVSLFKGEVRDKVDRMGEYGFSSNPPVNSEALIVFPGGDRSHGIVIGTENREHRKQTAPGETAIYNDQDMYVHLKANGTAEHTATKFKFQGANYELLDELSKLVQAIIDARVATALGPMPLLNAGDPFTDIKTRLEELKV